MESLYSANLDGAKKEEIIDQFQQQFTIANIQELMNKIIEKCFRKCITKPGTSLDGSEQKCLAMCMDRFMDSYAVVSKTYTSRVQRESNAA